MILSLLTPTPLSFGERDLSDRMFQEQLLVAALVLFPLSIVLGQFSIRLVSLKIPFVRSDIWNALVRILLADFIMEVFLQRGFQCIPFEEEEDLQELVLQSFGIGCPLYASPLSVRASGIVFGFRMAAICVGVFLGEGWCPIAIAGGASEELKDQLLDGPWETPAQEQEEEKEDDKTKEGEEKKVEKKRAQLEEGFVYLVNASSGILAQIPTLIYGLYFSGRDLVLVDIPLFYETSLFLRLFFCFTISTTPRSGSIVVVSEEDPAKFSASVEEARRECLRRIYGLGMTVFQIMVIMALSIPAAVYHKIWTATKEAEGNGDDLADFED